MVKYVAYLSADHEDCWLIYKIVEGPSRLIGPSRTEEYFEKTVCGKTKEQVKEYLHRLECPETVTTDGESCG